MGFLDNDATFEDGTRLGFTASPQSSIDLPSISDGGESLGGDASVAEQYGLHPSSVGMLEPGAGGSGLDLQAAGIPPLALARPKPLQSEQEYLESLPTMQKIGLALQTFGASMQGQPSPVERLLDRRRALMREDREALRSNIDYTVKGMALLDRLPPDSLQRKAVAEEFARNNPTMAPIFQATSGEREEGMRAIRAFQNPLVEKTVMDLCGGQGGSKFSQCVVGIAKDKDKMKELYAKADDSVWSATTAILDPAFEQAKKQGLLAKYQQGDGSFRIPEDVALELAEKSKLFKPEMLDALRRNPEKLVRFGVVPTKAAAKAQEAGLVAEASKAVRGADWSDPYTLNGALVQKNATTGEIRTAVSRPPREPKEKTKELTAAQELHDMRVMEARDALKGVSKDEMKKKRDKELPNGRPNPDYDPDIARNWRLAGEPLFADVKAKRDEAKGKPKPEAAPKKDEPKADAPKPDAKPSSLSANDRAKVIATATEHVNKGADPEAVKKRLKERFGIEVTFTAKKK